MEICYPQYYLPIEEYFYQKKFTILNLAQKSLLSKR